MSDIFPYRWMTSGYQWGWVQWMTSVGRMSHPVSLTASLPPTRPSTAWAPRDRRPSTPRRPRYRLTTAPWTRTSKRLETQINWSMWSFVKTIANIRENFPLSFSCVFGLQVFFKIYFKIDVHLAHSKFVIFVVREYREEV